VLQTSARLLRLLTLFQTRRTWTGADLSSRLEVTSRTLRRDVDRLRTLGYPVHSTTGVEGGYQLGAGSTLPPLLLEDDEAVAVAVALRTAASGTVSGIEEASARALLKLDQVLPSRLRRRVAALNSYIVPIARRGPTVDFKILSTIASACRDLEGIGFSYRAQNGAASERKVEPHRLVHTGQRWYLVAWDLAREDWRTFRVDRIEAKLTPGARFRPRPAPEGDFAAYVSRSVAYAPYRYRARIRMFAPAEEVAERIPPTAAIIEAIDRKTCFMHTGANSLDMVAIGLTMIGFDFEIEEPEELRAHVRLLAERFRRGALSGM
jgi:predicted DNA-binding transcriptional regulator YafY